MISLAWTQLPKIAKLLPISLQNEIQRRVYEEIPRHKLVLSPWTELFRLTISKLGLPYLNKKFNVQYCNERFDQSAANYVSKSNQITGVFSYFDTALETFRVAKRKKLLKIYELPTPYWRSVYNICEKDKIRRPEWANTLPASRDFEITANRRDEELQLADIVVVPSKFVLDSLNDAPRFKADVVVVPYGCNEKSVNLEITDYSGANRLKLLFAGTLAQSKGLGDLLEVVSNLQDKVSLTIAGENAYDLSVERFPWNCSYIGHVPNTELLRQMQVHDVFILPTLYEGLSIALLEAISLGMAVVSTTSCGLDVSSIKDQQALLLEPGRPAQLSECLLQLVNHSEKLQLLKKSARKWARKNTWEQYRTKLCDGLQPFLS